MSFRRYIDAARITQFCKKGEGPNVRDRGGFLAVDITKDGTVSIDPINQRIGDPDEHPCDMFYLKPDHARQLISALEAALVEIEGEAEEEDLGSIEEREEAISGPLTVDNGWDPEYPEVSYVYDADGKCLGHLVSIDPDAIAKNPDIQPWSKPAR